MLSISASRASNFFASSSHAAQTGCGGIGGSSGRSISKKTSKKLSAGKSRSEISGGEIVIVPVEGEVGRETSIGGRVIEPSGDVPCKSNWIISVSIGSGVSAPTSFTKKSLSQPKRPPSSSGANP